MQKSKIVILISLILIIVIGIVAIYFVFNRQEKIEYKPQNLLSMETINNIETNSIVENQVEETGQIDNKETQEQAIIEQEKTTEKKDTKENTSQAKQESKEVLSLASKSEESNPEETAIIVEETAIVTQTETETEPQTETQTTVVEDKQEEKIYCIDGGNTHILGDGENEHRIL